ncbi:hypothetical protein SAMN05428939_0121 [Streptomyces sp. TLI_105]|nr:hypothetical protein SAMN05428939_0121 [Streptomyces sp. TLI_105]
MRLVEAAQAKPPVLSAQPGPVQPTPPSSPVRPPSAATNTSTASATSSAGPDRPRVATGTTDLDDD